MAASTRVVPTVMSRASCSAVVACLSETPANGPWPSPSARFAACAVTSAASAAPRMPKRAAAHTSDGSTR